MKSFSCLALLLPFMACYSPTLANPSFFCHPDDNPACPDGQSCVNGRCVAGTVSGADLAIPSGADLAIPSGTDLAVALADLRNPSPPDLSVKHDLSACLGPGGNCTYHKNSLCCSNYCIYSSNTCR